MGCRPIYWPPEGVGFNRASSGAALGMRPDALTPADALALAAKPSQTVGTHACDGMQGMRGHLHCPKAMSHICDGGRSFLPCVVFVAPITRKMQVLSRVVRCTQAARHTPITMTTEKPVRSNPPGEGRDHA